MTPQRLAAGIAACLATSCAQVPAASGPPVQTLVVNGHTVDLILSGNQNDPAVVYFPGWLRQQPWFNGHAHFFGFSFGGRVALQVNNILKTRGAFHTVTAIGLHGWMTHPDVTRQRVWWPNHRLWVTSAYVEEYADSTWKTWSDWARCMESAVSGVSC